MNNETAQKIAKALLDCGAFKISLDPLFTWTSGIKSPVYCDLRALISDVETRRVIVDAFAELLKDQNFDVIAGTATAGIPWAAWIAEKLNKPMVYVRSEAKAHGTQKRVEGFLEKGARVALIEDHISTGKSSVAAVEALRTEADAQVDSIFAINTYELKKAAETFAAAGVSIQTVTNYSVILEVAKEAGKITEENVQLLKKFQEDPAAWAL